MGDLFPVLCHYCSNPAVAYCDYIMETRPLVGCDRAICNAHRAKKGHVCYRSKNKKMSDSIDYCTAHESDFNRRHAGERN